MAELRTRIDCPFDQSKCKEEEKILGYYKMTPAILEGCFSLHLVAVGVRMRSHVGDCSVELKGSQLGVRTFCNTLLR